MKEAVPGDSYYTPTPVARLMAAAAQIVCNGAKVADFSAGDGELLRAAESRWRGAEFIATDKSRAAICAIRSAHPKWKVGVCDFLNERSRSRCGVLKELSGVKLVLLNPPFSCRGGSKRRVLFDGTQITCGTALSFIIIALGFVAANGQLIALLPAGSLTSEKDASAWRLLRSRYRCDVLSVNGRGTFPDCTARTALVRFARRSSSDSCGGADERVAPTSIKRGIVNIVRGTIQMHTVNGHSSRHYVPLVHTTDVKSQEVSESGKMVARDRSVVRGPAVLIPRVGKPDKGKVAAINEAQEIGLSDCLIALRCRDSESSKKLQELLRMRWRSFARCYVGTGAPYITIRSLRHFLRGLGIGACTCRVDRIDVTPCSTCGYD